LSVVVRDDHTHSPDETNKEILEMRTNLKGKVIEASGLVDRVFEEAFHAIGIKKTEERYRKCYKCSFCTLSLSSQQHPYVVLICE
jgi:uncharacterized protein YmfQ (DUF2313 family)